MGESSRRLVLTNRVVIYFGTAYNKIRNVLFYILSNLRKSYAFKIGNSRNQQNLEYIFSEAHLKP